MSEVKKKKRGGEGGGREGAPSHLCTGTVFRFFPKTCHLTHTHPHPFTQDPLPSIPHVLSFPTKARATRTRGRTSRKGRRSGGRKKTCSSFLPPWKKRKRNAQPPPLPPPLPPPPPPPRTARRKRKTDPPSSCPLLRPSLASPTAVATAGPTPLSLPPPLPTLR